MNKHEKKDDCIESIKDLLKDGYPKKEIHDQISHELDEDLKKGNIKNIPTFQTIYDWINEVEERIIDDGFISDKEKKRLERVKDMEMIYNDLKTSYINEVNPEKKAKFGEKMLKHPYLKHI